MVTSSSADCQGILKKRTLQFFRGDLMDDFHAAVCKIKGARKLNCICMSFLVINYLPAVTIT